MKIHEYSLMKDVAASQLRPRVPQSLWQVSWPPVTIVNCQHGLYRHARHARVSSRWMSCAPVFPNTCGRWAAEANCPFCSSHLQTFEPVTARKGPQPSCVVQWLKFFAGSLPAGATYLL